MKPRAATPADLAMRECREAAPHVARVLGDPAASAVQVDPLADNTDAHRFYEALGFRSEGPRRFGPDSCVIHSLSRAAWREGNETCPRS